MDNIIEWLESISGETWSRGNHGGIEHHALIEDHEVLPGCQIDLDEWFRISDKEPYQQWMLSHDKCREWSPGVRQMEAGIMDYNPEFHKPRATDVIYSQEYRSD